MRMDFRRGRKKNVEGRSNKNLWKREKKDDNTYECTLGKIVMSLC